MSRLYRYGFMLLIGAGCLAAVHRDASARHRLLGCRRGACWDRGGIAAKGQPPAPPAVGNAIPAPPPAPRSEPFVPSPSDKPDLPDKLPPPPLPEGIGSISKAEIAAKTPNFFAYDYQHPPEAGKRYWLRVSDEYFIERYAGGKETRFEIVGRATVEGLEGTVVVRLVDGNRDVFLVFIADRTLEDRRLFFHHPDFNAGKWVYLGDMKNVE